MADGVVVDTTEKGEVVGCDFDLAPKHFDPSTLETLALPLRMTSAA